MPLKLVAFTEPDGASVYINPDCVVRVRPAQEEINPGAGCVIDLTEGFQAVKETMTEVRVALGSWKKKETSASPSS